MKILIINFEYPPLGGGGGVATRDIGRELAKRHTVHVITTKHSTLTGYQVDHGVHIHRVPVIGRQNMQAASLLSMAVFIVSAFVYGAGLCAKYSFDVLNAQFVIPSGIPAVLLSKLYRIPLVISFIGGDVYDPSKGISPHRHAVLRWLIRTISRGAVACTAISHDTKRRARKIHGVTQPITVTHLGYTPGTAPSADRSAYDIPRDAFVGVSTGRLVPRKGYDVLLRVWEGITDAHLVIIGDGPLMARLKKQAASGNLKHRVHFVGFVDDATKHSLLRAADIYVSAARHEGFGIVFLEAMDAGIPIVAPNDGGQKDFLNHNANALLVPPTNIRQIQEAVVKLRTDKALRDRLVAQGKRDVEGYTLEAVAVMFEKIFFSAAKSQ